MFHFFFYCCLLYLFTHIITFTSCFSYIYYLVLSSLIIFDFSNLIFFNFFCFCFHNLKLYLANQVIFFFFFKFLVYTINNYYDNLDLFFFNPTIFSSHQ